MNRPLSITTIVLGTLLGVWFLLAGSQKFLSAPMFEAMFESLGLPMAVVPVIGVGPVDRGGVARPVAADQPLRVLAHRADHAGCCRESLGIRRRASGAGSHRAGGRGSVMCLRFRERRNSGT